MSHEQVVIEVAYVLINGAVLLTAIGTLIAGGYCWYRLFRWALRRS